MRCPHCGGEVELEAVLPKLGHVGVRHLFFCCVDCGRIVTQEIHENGAR
jgi:DNA-directed RNA polymerase subunit RPC12/RpoP